MLKTAYLKIGSSARYYTYPEAIAAFSFLSIEYPERIKNALYCSDEKTEMTKWLEIFHIKNFDPVDKLSYKTKIYIIINRLLGSEPLACDYHVIDHRRGADGMMKFERNQLRTILFEFETLIQIK